MVSEMTAGNPDSTTMVLALVVIAKNEERCIARCLHSARAFVDKMVLLDTGSTDSTIEIAQACGASVHQSPWGDDFSAARNTALSLADADWHLILDADEWIESGAEYLRSAMSAPALGIACIRNEYQLSGNTALENAWIPRLLPKGVQYAGRIHEQPVSKLPRIRLPLVLRHDGYTPGPKQHKQGRNRRLLEDELKHHPSDPYLLYQMGKDCEFYGEHALACDYYIRAAANKPAGSGYAHDLVIRTLYVLGQANRREEALALANTKLEAWSDSPDFFFTLGNLLLDQALSDPGQALTQWLPMAEDAWLRCLEIGERPELSGSIVGRGSFLAAHNLSVIYAGNGDSPNAAKYRALSKQVAI